MGPPGAMRGISHRSVTEVPIAIVDLETTGFHAEGDRVVEIAIVRQDPGSEPKVVLETLVNPQRRVAATEIHGISDADVRGAPTFFEIAPLVTSSLNGAVLAAFNVYFDVRFLGAELARCGIREFPPHVCLMYMRPLLDLGSRCSLNDACRAHGVDHQTAHTAGDDAEASARLWLTYLEHMHRLEVRTFGDLAKRKSYKFTKSFDDGFLVSAPPKKTPRLKSRRATGSRIGPAGSSQLRRLEYWDALKAALADFSVSDQEVVYLTEKRRDLDLTDSEVRSLHATAFAGLLAELADDYHIDAREVEAIARMADALHLLGWTPGDRLGRGNEGARKSPAPRLPGTDSKAAKAERGGWFSRWPSLFGR